MVVTNWLLMITLAVGFFYSKAMLCCEELKTHVGCGGQALEEACHVAHPEMGNMTYPTCAALFEGNTDSDFADLSESQFVCTAFPQDTLIAKLYLILIMCTLVIPVRIVLTSLFTIGGSNPVPGNWSVKPETVRTAFGGPVAAMIQAGAFVMYSLFVNISKLNKAIVGVLMIVITVLLKPMVYVSRMIRYIQSSLAPAQQRIPAEDSAGKGGAMALLLAGPMAIARLLHWLLFQQTLDTFTYATVLALWCIITYVLLIYGSLLYDYMGPDAGPEVISAWGYSCLFELFGTEGIKILAVKTGISFVLTTVDRMLLKDRAIFGWYERHITSHLQLKYTDCSMFITGAGGAYGLGTEQDLQPDSAPDFAGRNGAGDDDDDMEMDMDVDM
ncbi:hypothetical protein CYMTET_15327 [Cymbomonas tetramitiformis]|uniref:Uncharacterized protein n=1 Tax=Cymbomonas tetramitiformis TaxID=36881 RepID=A0AAE0L915_9CHLO|nr:hypothetical protein CYMTET_15327 [Cymbomonas tetramitiformis]